MAATKQNLELELSVKSGKFKAKLLEAQKDLLALQNKSLKAGGANDILGAKIKKAANQVKLARNEYNLATNALKVHALQAHKTAGAVTKLGTKQKRSNMAMTQAAYAIDDMQYGFQGVQNNIQAMAVSMGASGPLIIGLTAVTVAVGLFVKKLKQQNKAAEEAKKVLKDADGTIAAMMLYASVAKDAAASSETQKEALDKLVKNGYDPLIGSVDDYIAKLREQARIESETAKHQSKVQDLLEKEREAQEKLNEAKKPSFIQQRLDEFTEGFANPQYGPDAISAEEYIANLVKERVKDKQKAYDLAKKETEEYLKQNKINTTGGLDTTEKKENKSIDKEDSVEDVQKKFFKLQQDSLGKSLELLQAQGATKKELLQAELDGLLAYNHNLLSLEDQRDVLHDISVIKQKISNIPLVKDVGIGLTKDDKDFAKLQADFTHLAELLEFGAITLEEYARRVENVSLAYGTDAISDNYDAMLTNIEDRTSLFRDAVGKAFSDLGNTIAQNLGSNGNALSAFLGAAVGTYTKLLATNKAFLAKMIPMKATESSVNAVTSATETASKIPFGAFVLPALIAGGLAAVSSAFSSAGAGGVASGGGGGGKSSKSVAVPSNQSSPNRENARMRNSNLIIPMDKMRYGNQVAENNYSGFN